VARAVIDHYWERRPAPWPLMLLADCHRYRALPRGGGRLDQDRGEMYLMRVAERAMEFAQKKSANWDKDDLKYFDWVME
jgi:hypothetical protein